MNHRAGSNEVCLLSPPSSRVDQRCTKSAQPNDPHDPTTAAANIGSSPNRGSQSSSRRRCRGANATEFSCQAPTLRTLRVTSPSSHQPHHAHPDNGSSPFLRSRKRIGLGSLTSPPTASGLLEPHCKGLFEKLHEKAQNVLLRSRVCQREQRTGAARQ